MTLPEALVLTGRVSERWRKAKPRSVRIRADPSHPDYPEGVAISVRPRVENAAEFNALADITHRVIPWETVNVDASVILTTIDEMLEATLAAVENAPKSVADRPVLNPIVMSEEWSKWRQQMLTQYGEDANYALCIASLQGAVSSESLDLPDLTSICRSAWTARETAKEESQKQLLAELRD